jgi:hypothetical protein
VTAGLLLLSLAAPPGAAGLQKGDELTFAGSVAEAVDRPAHRFRRKHSLELRVLVLEATDRSADVAVLTRLKRTDDAVTGAVGVVTGSEADRNTPPSIRLDLIRVHADGTVHLLTPSGPPPLKLTADTPARTLPPPALDAFSPHEFGVFPPHPPHENRGEPWSVATPGRPTETWQARDTTFVNAERCRLLLMNQMSADWETPVGGQTAWHRADAVWVSTQDGTARKVHRVIRQRDGKSESPSTWVEIRYELTEQGRLSGRTLDRSRRDVEVAYTALNDATTLVPEAAKLGTRTLEARLARLDAQIEETHPTSPYREAMLAARRALDGARRGEIAPLQPAAATLPGEAVVRPRWPQPGDTAPDFTAGTFRLAEHRGRPVILVFFRPGGETAERSLAIAHAAAQRYSGRAVVATFAVFGDPAAGARDRDRLKLDIPVYDGSPVVTRYGIETAPRFLLIDTAGKVRWEFTGVGGETGFLLKEQADHLVPPASPGAPTGIIPASRLALPPIVPRP